jgi:hypothetical protein
MLFLPAGFGVDDFCQLRIELGNGFVSYKHGHSRMDFRHCREAQKYKPRSDQGALKEL